MNRHWTEIKAVDKDGQLLNRYHLFGLNSRELSHINFREIIENFVAHIVNNHVRQKLFVKDVCFEFTLEKGEEHFTELFNRNQTFLVFNHFVKLLFKVIENPIVHNISIYLLENLSLITTCSFLNLVEIFINNLTSHRRWSLLLTNVLQTLFAFIAFRKLKTFLI